MNLSFLEEVERRACQLPYEQQLLLIEHLISRMRKDTAAGPIEDQLAAMAADPEIQQELQTINTEFATIEADGLE